MSGNGNAVKKKVREWLLRADEDIGMRSIPWMNL